MSVNPAGPTPSAAVDAFIEAELNALAAGAQALLSELEVGQIVSARVLPSNGLTDQLEMLGNRVAASLPPTLQPGDIVQVQVTGFNGDQVLLQVLDTQSPDGQTTAGGAAAGTPALPDMETEGNAPPTPPPVAPETPTPAAIAPLGPPATGTSPVAPPIAVLVAATVQAAPGGRVPTPPIPGAPTAAGSGPQIPPAARAIPFPITTGLAATSIEARLAAARTGPRPSSTTPEQTPSGTTPSAAPTVPPTPVRPFVPPPPIAPSVRAAGGQPQEPAAPVPAGSTPSTPAASSASALPTSAYRDPVVLVRALGLPVTPTTVAAAKLALENPQRLPNALATLERALPSGDDPRVVTLRAVAGFVSRIDPRSPELATQIEAYVEHVVDGGEAKLATALAARAAAEAPPATSSATASGGGATAIAAQAGEAAAEAPLAVVALANAALRAVDLLHDLKLQLFSLLGSPPATSGDELSGSSAGALTAITAVQLNTADALAAAPQTVAFTLPLWTGSGYTQARIAVDRDAPQQPGVPLDGDNFHIAFILDTKHLGTVGVDLQAVGRAVNLAVKTEALPAAQRFGSALGRLTERLQKLRYRVASADAAVAATASTFTETPPAEAPPTERPAPGELNLRA